MCFWFTLKFLDLMFTGLKDELLAAQAEARDAMAQLEAEVALNRWVRTAISDLSTSWEVEPMDGGRELEATHWSTSCATWARR